MKLIDADAIEYKESIIDTVYQSTDDVIVCHEKRTLKWVSKEDIDKMPTIEANPFRHGKWIYVEDVPLEDGQTEFDREAWYQCSECDAYDLRLKDSHANYCWSCGAKMDLDEVEECTSHR